MITSHPEALERFRGLLEAARRQRLAPPPRLSVSEWADRYRVLSSVASAEPGPWSTDRAPYLREPMDAFGDPLIERIVLMWASQTGKTEVLLNYIGFCADLSPAPMMMIQPNIEMAEGYSKDRVAPMIRESPRLAALFGDPTSRSSGNTLRHKPFPGGHLTLGGANSPAGLAGRPLARVVLDEVDRYPKSAGTEGDPISLAEARTANFPMRKIGMTSTPGLKGESRIEEAFLESDQRHYHVPCPKCKHKQRLEWRRLRYEGLPEPAYQCEKCDGLIGEEYKHRMLAGGEWVPYAEGAAARGYHLNALYSPWASWSDLAEMWQQAQGNPTRLQTFVNTKLAETWEDRVGEQVGAEGLAARREQYPAPCPPGVVVITVGIDVQADRLEVFTRGWGAAEESWLLGHAVVPGDVTTPAPWQQLDDVARAELVTPDGEIVTPVAIAIDSGHYTEMVLRWGIPRFARGVWIVKGGSEIGKPLVSRRPTVSGKGRGRVWMVGTRTSQDRFYGQLRIQQPGPGFIHLPEWVDDELIGELTAEVRKSVIHRGRREARWLLPRGAHNEAADGMRYADVARELAGFSPERLTKLASEGKIISGRRVVAAIAERVEEAGAAQEEAPAPRRRTGRRHRTNWVTGWRG